MARVRRPLGNVLTPWTANVCQALADIRSSLEAYAEDFAPALLRRGEPEAVLEQARAIEAMAATIKALVAGFLADVGHWKGSGHRNDAEAMARATGMSPGAARESIETGRRLEKRTKVSEAARRGELSATQTSMIANAAEANPGAEDALLEKARASSLPELRDECARARASADPDPDATYRRIHDGRDLRGFVDVEGVFRLLARGTRDAGAQIMAALEARAERLFWQARAEGRREPPGAYLFDALVELAMADTSSDQDPALGTGADPSGEATRSARPRPRRRGAAVSLLLRLDYSAFLRGVAIEGEICEVAGFGPIPVSVAEALLEAGDPFVAAILTKGKALVGVAHLGRRPTAHQDSALRWLSPTCAVEGCTQRARLQRDHRIDWAQVHVTVFEWLDLLCPFHHGLKTRENWALLEGTGKRPFVPPEDPRHPRHKRRSPAA